MEHLFLFIAVIIIVALSVVRSVLVDELHLAEDSLEAAYDFQDKLLTQRTELQIENDRLREELRKRQP